MQWGDDDVRFVDFGWLLEAAAVCCIFARDLVGFADTAQRHVFDLAMSCRQEVLEL